jgi:hypothetical protein
VTLLTILLLLASSLQAVEYDHAVDFSRYTTWSWQAGVLPPELVPDQRIREALARELAACGLPTSIRTRRCSSGTTSRGARV